MLAYALVRGFAGPLALRAHVTTALSPPSLNASPARTLLITRLALPDHCTVSATGKNVKSVLRTCAQVTYGKPILRPCQAMVNGTVWVGSMSLISNGNSGRE